MSAKILAYNTAKGGFDYVQTTSDGRMMVSIDDTTITINDEDLLAQLAASNVVAEATRAQLVAQLQSAMSVHGATLVQLQDSNTVAEASRVFLEGVVIESALTNLKLDSQLDQTVASNTVIQAVKSSVDATNSLLALPLTVKRSQLGSYGNVANDTSLAPDAATSAYDISAYGWVSGFYEDGSITTFTGVKMQLSFDNSTWIEAQNNIYPMTGTTTRTGFIYKTDVPAINYIRFKNASATDTLSNVYISLTGASF